MAKGDFGVRVYTNRGEPVTVGDATLTPQSQAVVLRWPNGGFVWNRPVAVRVEQGGDVRQIPILDITRLVQVGLWVFWIILVFRTAGRLRRQRRG